MKETKSVLTREGIKKDLLGEMRAGVMSVVALVMTFALIGTIMTFLAFRPGVGRLICGSLWFLLIAYFVFAYAKSYVWIARDRFSVVEDELLYSAEETVHRGRTLMLERALYFAEHGRYKIQSTDGSAFSYSNEGDRFYLVVYDGKKPKKKVENTVLRVYNTRIYEFRGKKT